MSNIYIQEPPSSGKVLLKTTVGDIDIELWSKEAPKACRNFIQLCLEGYYHDTIFHRIVKGFIAQGGDPTGTGTGGESIYGSPFKDEFHSRLRFVRRGLVAMANAGKDDNASQFFFTLAATPELQNKHTIFGKVTGETVFNMIKLEDALVDHDDRPKYPQKILKTEVLSNPFPDIVPRTTPKEETGEKKEKKKDKSQAVKNFKLLSFGEEAEEDEELTIEANQKYASRSKSTHDVLEDPTLSAVPAVEKDSSSDSDGLSEDEDDYRSKKKADSGKDREKLDEIRNKLKKSNSDGSKSFSKLKSSTDESKKRKVEEQKEEQDEEEEEYVFGQAAREEKRRKTEGIRKEIQELKKSYQQDKKKRENDDKSSKDKPDEKDSKSSKIDVDSNPMLKDHKETEKKYKEMKSKMPKKGASRENFTLGLLEKFRQKLHGAKEKAETEGSDAKDKEKDNVEDDDDDNSDTWLAHKLEFETSNPVLAKDANTKDNDWYEISDPRSKISQKRREISKAIMKKRI